MAKKALPIGVDDFADMINSGYYYVDKTMFIKELLDLKGKVNLFTRPRRFGKTLNLSMLRYFFEDTGNGDNAERRKLFQGLEIAEAGEAYMGQMASYPVINLTLKSSKQDTFQSSYYKMREEIASEFGRHRELLKSPMLSENEKRKFQRITDGEADYSAEQADAAEEVIHGIDRISDVVQSNMATAEKSAAASEELSSQANMLKELVAKFRLKD